MTPRSLTRALGAAFALAAIAVGVFFLWPVQLGGWTGYAIVDGTSMEPGLSTGDLVLTRARGDYAVGDAVLYESELLDANVLHRIVSVDGDRFTFRGDNRDENDPEQLTQGAVLGSLWLTLPAVGKAFLWLDDPVHLAIVVFALVLIVLGGGSQVSRRRRRGVDPVPVAAEERPRDPAQAVVPAARGLLVAGVVALVAFGVLGLLAWTHPATTSRTVVGGYAHTGTFAYEARARYGAAYPDGKVVTGQPVFLRLSRLVDVAFDYRFTAERPATVEGTTSLALRIADGQGWERTIPLVAAQPFSGPSARVEGVIDLRRVTGILERYQASTGASVSSARVTVVPRLEVRGAAGGIVVDEPFAPELPFTLDTVALRLAEPETTTPGATADQQEVVAASPLAPRAEGSAVVVEPAPLSLGPWLTVGVDRARAVAALGIVLALLTLALAAGLLLRRGGTSERDRIAARFGSRIVPARATIPESRWVTELDDIESLVRIAEAYDRIVLQVVDPDGADAYLVDDGIAVYRYRTRSAGPLGTPRAAPVHGR